MTRRRPLSHVSVATRLALVALVVTLLSLAVTAAVGLTRGSDLADAVIETRLETVAASHATQVEFYLGSLRREVAGLAASPGAVDAIERLAAAAADLATPPVTSQETSELTEHYLEAVIPALREVRGQNVGVSFLVPEAAAAVRLQLAYTVPSVPAAGGPPLEPSLVSDAGDGSTYSAEHARLHPVYGEIAARSGYDDLLLIEARTATIVYSYRKRVDFATSLAAGPHSGSSLSALVDRLGRDPSAGAALTDFAPYTPAADRPTAFVASPVLDADRRLVGFVAVSLATAGLDAILSSGGSWVGAGEGGDTYLAGADATLRSASRWWTQSPDAEPAALGEAQLHRIRATGTPALVQGVDRRLVEAAATGPGIARSTNVFGQDVVTGYHPVVADQAAGLTWAVVVEELVSVLDEPVADYARTMLFTIALFVVAVTFIAVRWSNALVAPLRSIADRLRIARSRDLAPDGAAPLPPRSPSEFEALSNSVDEMLERLDESRVARNERVRERSALLRRFLPASLVQRLETPGESMVDHASRASVAVVVIDGLGAALGREGEGALRQLVSDIIDDLDALAADHGLERVKITGDGYYAVCGVHRPYLDHAARAAAFALGARDLVVDLLAGHGEDLSVRVGIDSGAVAVGLTGGDGLVLDAWGPAVSGASGLARRGAPGAVVVSEATRRQLPGEFVLAGDRPDLASSGAAMLTGRAEHADGAS